MSSGIGIDSFINALIIGHLLSNGYRTESVLNYFTMYDEATLNWDSMITFVAFHAGGVVASIVNVLCNKYPYVKKDHPTWEDDQSLKLNIFRWGTIWLSLLVWLAGHTIIGYYGYSELDWLGLSTTPINIPERTYKLEQDRYIIFIMISTFGGYFYWGTLGLSLKNYKFGGPRTISTILIDLVSTPVFAILVNVCFASVLQPQGGYLYSYRLMSLVSGVMVIMRLITCPGIFIEENKNVVVKDVKERESLKTRKPKLEAIPENTSVKGLMTVEFKTNNFSTLLHMTSVVFQMTYLFIPTIIIPRIVPSENIYYTINILFGGMILGSFVGAVFLAMKQISNLNVLRWTIYFLDFLGIMSTMTILILFCKWNNIMDHSFAFAFSYGISIGILQAVNVHRGFIKGSNISAVWWTLLCASSSLIGTSIGTLYVNDNWTSAMAPIELIAFASTALGVSLVELFLNVIYSAV
jgi:hypothetical protein